MGKTELTRRMPGGRLGGVSSPSCTRKNQSDSPQKLEQKRKKETKSYKLITGDDIEQSQRGGRKRIRPQRRPGLRVNTDTKKRGL